MREDLERVVERVRSFREQPTPEARPLRPARRRVGDLAERAPPVRAAPVDELRDRAAVRAGEHRRADRRRPARERGHLVGDARHLLRLPGRQADRHHDRDVAGHALARRAAGAELAGHVPRRRRRRDRLHGVAADLEPRVQRSTARPGQDRRPRRGRRRDRVRLGRRQLLRRVAGAACAPASSRRPRRTWSTSSTTSTPSTTTSAERTTRRSRSSSTATTSARTAVRPRSSSASCSTRSATTCATSGATCRSTTCTRAPRRAAEAAEAAAAQGRFWDMHDRLLAHQDELSPRDLCAPREGSSASTSSASRRTCARASTPQRVADDVRSADASGVAGTPTFFINGQRYQGAYDLPTLTRRRARGALAGRAGALALAVRRGRQARHRAGAVAEPLGDGVRLLDRDAAEDARGGAAAGASSGPETASAATTSPPASKHRRRDDGQAGLELVDERRVAALAHGGEVLLERGAVDERARREPLEARRGPPRRRGRGTPCRRRSRGRGRRGRSSSSRRAGGGRPPARSPPSRPRSGP